MNTIEILNRLKEGNNRYVKGDNEHSDIDLLVRKNLVDGQQPMAIILSCADSRVIPEYVFDVGLGELFVVRVAGNVANQSSIASIEYAVAHLNTKLIVVMGHQNCGAVTAALGGPSDSLHLNHLIDHIKPSLKPSDSVQNLEEVIQRNAHHHAHELTSRSNIIRDAIENNGLQIKTAYYHFDTGKVTFLD